ncbi:MAG: GNAT family N-acetyltransferase [Chloroflexi bacterium]|nr:MAG: GNAT family N-acetyltransferase [Chloroflexota bacterium]
MTHIRPAQPDDIPAILTLVNEHARRGDLLPRTAESIQATLPDWLVATDDNQQIIGCVSLLTYTPTLAEVRSLAVADTHKGNGVGQQLVTELITLAHQRQVPVLFALTRAVRFFLRLNFQIVSREQFPEKIWRDCVLCPLQHACDETAVVLNLSNHIQKELNHVQTKN